jgi:hypothetical protein
MIGPQWPLKPGAQPAWPKLPRQKPTPASHASTTQGPSNQTPTSASEEKKRAFFYERPTLPDRKPKLPNNWVDPNNKKPGNKNPNNKKPQR